MFLKTTVPHKSSEPFTVIGFSHPIRHSAHLDVLIKVFNRSLFCTGFKFGS